MTTHPWTNYEVARMRDEERLLRARSAMLVREAREARRSELQSVDRTRATSWLERIRRRPGVVADRAPAGSGA
jgi:hypothetical protein